MPDPTNLFDYNRYMYVRGNPLKYNDPSGHDACGQGTNDYCDEYLVLAAKHPEVSYQQFIQGRILYYNFLNNPEVLLQNHLALGTSAEARMKNALAQTYGELYLGKELYAETFTVDYLQAISEAAYANGEQQMGFAVAALLGMVIGITDCSFSADTAVTTQNGEQPIVQVKVGDQVLAWNQITGETGYYTVTATLAHFDPTIVRLTINGETIETTPEHPFFTIAGEWVPAGELRVGNRVYATASQLGIVEAISTVTQLQVMYNLSVAEAHTFFVGNGQWLVHNVCGAAKSVGLPTSGKIRYVPPEAWNKNQPLPRGPNGGYMDKFDNEWVKGPSRTSGQDFEWDVQLSRQGRAQLGQFSRDGRHLNVSLDGRITHR